MLQSECPVRQGNCLLALTLLTQLRGTAVPRAPSQGALPHWILAGRGVFRTIAKRIMLQSECPVRQGNCLLALTLLTQLRGTAVPRARTSDLTSGDSRPPSPLPRGSAPLDPRGAGKLSNNRERIMLQSECPVCQGKLSSRTYSSDSTSGDSRPPSPLPRGSAPLDPRGAGKLSNNREHIMLQSECPVRQGNCLLALTLLPRSLGGTVSLSGQCAGGGVSLSQFCMDRAYSARVPSPMA